MRRSEAGKVDKAQTKKELGMDECLAKDLDFTVTIMGS